MFDAETIKRYCKEAHENAIDKGFYDCPECTGLQSNRGEPYICDQCNDTGIDQNKNIGELLMLIVSELGEALEAHRCGKFADHSEDDVVDTYTNYSSWYEEFYKDTFEDEIADVFIRLFDLCAYKGWELFFSVSDFSYKLSDNVPESLLEISHTVCHIAKEAYNINVVLNSLTALCKRLNIHIEKHIEAKMAYNKTRPRKHGKEY